MRDNFTNAPDDGGDDGAPDDGGPDEDEDTDDPADRSDRDSRTSDKDDDAQTAPGSDDKDQAPGSSTKDDDPKDADDGGSPVPSTYLPAGYKPGVWYQKVQGEFIETDATDPRELGPGDFYMVSEDGLQSVRLIGSDPNADPNVDPNAPDMTGYQSYRPQDQKDVGAFGGAPIPGTTVYVYDDASTLPAFLRNAKPSDDDTGWTFTGADGTSYQVHLTASGGAEVYRTPRKGKHQSPARHTVTPHPTRVPRG